MTILLSSLPFHQISYRDADTLSALFVVAWLIGLKAVLRLTFGDQKRTAKISKSSCDLPHGAGATSDL